MGGADLGITNQKRSNDEGMLSNRPRAVFNKLVRAPFGDFTGTEISKALASMAPHEAPGPGGVVSELLRNLPCFLPQLVQLVHHYMYW